GEQELTDLIRDRLPPPGSRLSFELDQLFLHLEDRSPRIRPVEPHVRGALLDPEGRDQRVLVPWRHAFLRECNRFIVLHLASGPGIIPAPVSVSTSGRGARGWVVEALDAVVDYSRADAW